MTEAMARRKRRTSTAHWRNLAALCLLLAVFVGLTVAILLRPATATLFYPTTLEELTARRESTDNAAHLFNVALNTLQGTVSYAPYQAYFEAMGESYYENVLKGVKTPLPPDDAMPPAATFREDFAPVMEKLQAAVEKPYFLFAQSYNLVSLDRPVLYTPLLQFLRAAVLRALEEHDYAEAARRHVLLVRTARLLNQEGIPNLYTVWEIWSWKTLSTFLGEVNDEPTLAALENTLQSLQPSIVPRTQVLEHFWRTLDSSLISPVSGVPIRWRIGFRFFIREFWESTDEGQKDRQVIEQTIDRPVLEAVRAYPRLQEEEGDPESRWRHRNVWHSLPRVLHESARAELAQVGTRVLLAIRRYYLARSAYPETLAALQPDFCSSLPSDPFTGNGLEYKRTETEICVYSRGLDEQDNGGQEGADIVAGCMRLAPVPPST